MKKFLLVISLVVLALFSFTACESKKVDKLAESVSFCLDSSFVGENNDYTVIIESGSKEEVFVDDGKVGKIVPFTNILVIPHKKLEMQNFEISIVENSNESNIKLQKDMFTGNFETTLNKKINPSKACINSEYIDLKNETKNYIKKDKILQILKQNLKDEVDSGYKDNAFNKEIYIKLVRDNYNIKGETFWYVALIENENSFCSMLLDAKTGKVLSVKKAK